jgi:hypothetical protein
MIPEEILEEIPEEIRGCFIVAKFVDSVQTAAL